MSDQATAENGTKVTPEQAKAERPDTTEDVRRVDDAIFKLETAAVTYRDRDEGYIHLIGLYTFIATLVAAFNMMFKENLEKLGGWVPFCLATASLTGLATYYSGKLKREEPRTHKERCLRFRWKADVLRRKFVAKKLAASTHDKLQRSFIALKSEAAEYLLPPSKGTTRWWGHFWLFVILLAYAGWSGLVLYRHYYP